MRTSRQEYKDANLEEALKAGCDTLQLKYDGWWARMEVIAGDLKIYTRTGRHLPDFDRILPEPINTTIIGELMYGTNWSQRPALQGKLFAFDCWSAEHVDLEGIEYGTRYQVLKSVLPFLGPSVVRIPNFPIDDYTNIWKTFIASGEYEGLVFRRKKDAVGATLLRQKNLITDEYTCLALLEGEGKHQGRLGSVVCGDASGQPLRTADGRPATCGGGFDDEEREAILKNPTAYIGRKFEVEGKARFSDSGLLRHPNFVRWKDA
jgi:hypothetical protein